MTAASISAEVKAPTKAKINPHTTSIAPECSAGTEQREQETRLKPGDACNA